MESPARKRLRLIAELVLLVLVALGLLIAVLATEPREALCPQAADLARARLLDQAQEIYADPDANEGDCKGGREAVEGAQVKAARAFEAARIHGATGVPKPKPEPKPAEPTTAAATKTEEQKAAEKAAAEAAKEAADKAAAERQRAIAGAIPEYVAGLELSPFETAARLALGALVKELDPPKADAVADRCKLGERMATAGLLEEAAPVLSSVPFSAAAACDAALQKLQSQRAAADGSLREARRLDAEGETDRARDKFAEALLANVGLGDARTGLEESIEEGSRLDAVGDWLEGVPGTLKAQLDWLLPLAAMLLVGGLLLMLAIWIGVRELSVRSLAVRELAEEWGRRPGFSFLYHAAVPQVSIGEFDAAADVAAKGKDFSAMLEAVVVKPQGREPAFPFDRVGKDRTSSSDLEQLTGLLAEVPQTKLLGSTIKVLSKLFRRRIIRINGRLNSLTRQGASVVLALEGNGQGVGAEVTLWEKDYVPKPGGAGADRWLRLLPAAAAWTRWQLAAAHAYPRQIGENHWLADARFQAALAWQASEDLPRAEDLYASTIELDPTMLPAAHNLAVLQIRASRYELAVPLIRRLRERLASVGMRRASAGRPWRRARCTRWRWPLPTPRWPARPMPPRRTWGRRGSGPRCWWKRWPPN